MLFTKIPFQDITIVPLSSKCQDQVMFDNQLQLHNCICQNSRAIKLSTTFPEFLEAICIQACKELCASDTIIDIAKASSTAVDGSLYIQCFERDKSLLTDLVRNFIATYYTIYPEDDKPILVANKPDGTDSSIMTHHTNTGWNRLQHVLDDPTLTSAITNSKVKPTIPEMIHTKPFTYAEATQASQIESQVHHTSAISSPTNSQVTITSARLHEIEDKVDC